MVAKKPKPNRTQIDEILEPRKQKPSLISYLRGRFLAGVVIAAPITITIYLVWGFISWIDRIIKPNIPKAWNPETYIPDTVDVFGFNLTLGLPGLGLLVAVIILTFLGAVGANLIGRALITAGDRFLSNVPVVKNIYSLFKQLFETIASNQESSFRDMVLVEYPKKGTWCIGFVTAPIKGEVLAKLGEGMIGVFVPTTPNPTSGFYMFVPKAEVIDLDMSVEEGAKMIVSVGMVVPEHLSQSEVEEVISQIPSPAGDSDA
jgi:uncharacterized membrane protein